MPVTESQLETIFRYFDGELTDAEEEQLLRQLQQDSDLQQAFDQQVMMRQYAPEILVAEPLPAEFEPVDAYLERVTGKPENRPVSTPVVAVVKRNYRWVAAAAVLVCLLAGAAYYFLKPGEGNQPIVNLPARDSLPIVHADPPRPKDTIATIPLPQPEKTISLPQLYADNQGPFRADGQDIPVAAEPSQQLYEQQQYKELLDLKAADMEEKGRGDSDEEQLAIDYFHFYQALAFLESNKPAQAEKLLEPIIRSGNRQLHYPARWYILLAYLKMEDKQHALQMAESLTGKKGNPYYKKASQVKAALSK